MTRTQSYRLLGTLLLSFALAGCASKGAPSSPGARRGESAPQSTPPGSSSTSGRSSSESTSASRESSARMTPTGDRVEIRASWVQVRNQPSNEARAIALAFGNDTYPVLDKQGDWVKVQIDKNREGWIPKSATEGR
jgi:Bacterial SH3 domain